jgi:hypothetical protein
MPSVRIEPDGENLENGKQLITQQSNRHYDYHDSQCLAKTEAVVPGFKTAGYQTENVERGEPEHQYPQDIEDVTFLVRKLNQSGGEYAGRPAGQRTNRMDTDRMDMDLRERRGQEQAQGYYSFSRLGEGVQHFMQEFTILRSFVFLVRRSSRDAFDLGLVVSQQISFDGPSSQTIPLTKESALDSAAISRYRKANKKRISSWLPYRCSQSPVQN